MEPTERVLTKLAIRDDALMQSIFSGSDESSVALSSLDAKTHALVRVAALIALDAALPSYLWAVEHAHGAGATDDEIVGCLVAIMPAVGAARAVSAAPRIGLALGYDVAEALEEPGALLS